MKTLFITLSLILSSLTVSATVHIVKVWDGYFQFVDAINFSPNITIQLGDTVQWLPLDFPTMVHTITATNIPDGAATFDQIWQAPADTFFQYVPTLVGLYEYECTPHAVQFGMVGSIQVEDATGIQDPTFVDGGAQLYPNPAVDVINFIGVDSTTKVRIYSIKGDLVLSGITDGPMDVTSLFTGSYLVELVGDKSRIIKLVKK